MQTNVTSGAIPERRVGRSVLAIVVGFVVVIVITLSTDQALHSLKVYPPWRQRMDDGQALLALAYRLAYGIVGSYITARLAPRRPMQHALLGAAIGIVLSAAGAIATWNRDLGPHWYAVALIVTALPCAWIGGKIFLARKPGSEAYAGD